MDPSFSRAVEGFRQRLGQYDWSSQSPYRRQILEVFLRLALEHGFNSVSLRMIAAEIGIKAPSIYAHFPDGRDEIVAASLRWHFHKFGTAVLESLADCRSADEAWTAMVGVHLRRQLQLPESNLWDLLIATDGMVHNLPSDLSAEANELVALYEELYRAAAREMGVEHPDEAIKLVMTLLEGAGRWCTGGEDPHEFPELAARADALTRAMLGFAAERASAAQ
ncbi:TetR/AcrR family transcriptional regulator [Mycolicibacterium setense]